MALHAGQSGVSPRPTPPRTGDRTFRTRIRRAACPKDYHRSCGVAAGPAGLIALCAGAILGSFGCGGKRCSGVVSPAALSSHDLCRGRRGCPGRGSSLRYANDEEWLQNTAIVSATASAANASEGLPASARFKRRSRGSLARRSARSMLPANWTARCLGFGGGGFAARASRPPPKA